MTTAIVIKIFLILGKRNIRQKINAKIVAVWPEGKECHFESNWKKSNDDKLYKWNSRKWIEVDIDRVDDTLAYDKEYIKYLLMEVKHGRREYEELTEIEQSQIKGYIREHGRNQDIE